MKKKKLESLREWNAARRKAEIAEGLRDGRFVEKTMTDKRRKRRKKGDKHAQSELREGEE